MNKETAINLLNSALDVLYDCFGEEWLVNWGIDQGLSDQDIENWLVDDVELIARCREEAGPDED
jgi:hypothetical protein